MTSMFTRLAISGAAAGLSIAALPAAATPFDGLTGWGAPIAESRDPASFDSWDHSRGRHDRDYRYGRRAAYSEPVYSDTRVWRGRDGRYYCRRRDGTTGLLIGGAVGGLIGHELAGRGDRTLGVIVGAAGGALLGRAIDRSNSRCR